MKENINIFKCFSFVALITFLVLNVSFILFHPLFPVADYHHRMQMGEMKVTGINKIISVHLVIESDLEHKSLSFFPAHQIWNILEEHSIYKSSKAVLERFCWDDWLVRKNLVLFHPLWWLVFFFSYCSKRIRTRKEWVGKMSSSQYAIKIWCQSTELNFKRRKITKHDWWERICRWLWQSPVPF